MDVTAADPWKQEGRDVRSGLADLAEADARELLELAPDPIVVVDARARIVAVNRQAEAMFGYGRAELIGQSLDLLIPERFREVHRDHHVRYYQEPRTRPMGGTGLELYARRKDGSELPVEISLGPLKTGHGLLVTAIVRDISERKRTDQERAALLRREQAAHAQAERMAAERAAILDQIADGVIVAGPDGRVVFANETARRYYEIGELGKSIEEYSRRLRPSRSDGQPYASEELPLARAVSRGETTVGAEWRVRRHDGMEVLLEGSAAPVRAIDGTQVGAVLTLRDVTARLELERQKDEFLASISHDLRTPVTAIKASIGVVLANEPAEMPQPLHRMLVNIDLAADRLTTLVNDLLELTRLQAGLVQLRRSPTDLRALALRCARSIEPLARARGQRVGVDVPPRPFLASVDAARVERALLNLLGNAHKYGREGGQIRLCLVRRDGQARFAVADDGPGIPEAEQARIFERFYRAEAAAAGGAIGSGLGLPIARAMAELHGGRLWVESTVGRGSTFYLSIPTDIGVEDGGEEAAHEDPGG